MPGVSERGPGPRSIRDRTPMVNRRLGGADKAVSVRANLRTTSAYSVRVLSALS